MTNVKNCELWQQDLRPVAVTERVCGKVLGQEDGCRKMVTSFMLMCERCAMISRGFDVERLPNARGMLIMGTTASGKSYAIKTMLAGLGIERFTADCASLTGEGWRGGSVSDVLLPVADWQTKHKGQICAIVWDEFDKIVRKTQDNDASFSAAPALLKPLDGGIYDIPTEGKGCKQVNMDLVINIFAGAFTGIEEIVRRRLLLEYGGSTVGFSLDNSNLIDVRNADIDDLRNRATVKDLVDWGLPWELCGRIFRVVSFKTLSRETLKEIALGPFVSRYANIMPSGCDLSISNDAAEIAAQYAVSSELGARGIESALGGAIVDARAAARDCNDIVRVEIGIDGEHVVSNMERGVRLTSSNIEELLTLDFDGIELEKFIDGVFDDYDNVAERAPYISEMRRLVTPTEFATLTSAKCFDRTAIALLGGFDGVRDDEAVPALLMLKTMMLFTVYRYREEYQNPETILSLLTAAHAGYDEFGRRASALGHMVSLAIDRNGEGSFGYDVCMNESGVIGENPIARFDDLPMYLKALTSVCVEEEDAIARVATRRLAKALVDKGELDALRDDLKEILKD